MITTILLLIMLTALVGGVLSLLRRTDRNTAALAWRPEQDSRDDPDLRRIRRELGWVAAREALGRVADAVRVVGEPVPFDRARAELLEPATEDDSGRPDHRAAA